MVLYPKASSGLFFPQQAAGNFTIPSRPPKREGGLKISKSYQERFGPAVVICFQNVSLTY
jgi:hypothetical protein